MGFKVVKIRNVEQRGETFYAVVEIPPSLRPAMGGKKRLRKTLGTNDPALARVKSFRVVADLKEQIATAKGPLNGGAILDEARALRSEMKEASPEEAQSVLGIIAELAHHRLGKPVSPSPDPLTGEYEYDPVREKEADAFFKLASGQATPIDEFVDLWLAETSYRPRTEGDHRRAVKRLKEWGCDTLESVTRKKAGEFISHLVKSAPPHWTGDFKTVNKLKSSLSAYWIWLRGKGHVENNIWTDQPIARRKPNIEGPEEKERAFTDDEIFMLLNGPADQLTADIIRIGALSGMRIDEICSLKVTDCQNNIFSITRAKTNAGLRTVPIHPDLTAIITRRTKGKKPDRYIFEPDLTPPSKESTREISMPAVKRFSRYIRAVKVAVKIEGKRRSLTNFHSLRRWFITKAEQAGQPETIIAAVVGHKRDGMTLGVYSAGPSGDQFRKCVEAVMLPRTAPSNAMKAQIPEQT